MTSETHKENQSGESRPRVGLESSVEKVIPHEWTLAAFNPGLPAVLSTPAMIGMMEIAASQAVLPELPPGAITVGTRIEVDHLKAVPGGTTVRATARLVKHEGRFLVFDVEARAGEVVLGRGRVFRAIVEPQKFTTQAKERARS
ncbi:MAG TPA: hotdog domain-containing protein [Candidatus Acidoferrales bacterium]|nr:hotdog domain-containing protein [Candidatus Acidoferrales bacterium]